MSRAWIMVFLVAACGGEEETAAPAPPEPPPEPLAGVSLVSIESGWLDDAPEGAPLVVSSDAMSLGDQNIVALRAGGVDPSQVQGGGTGYLVTPLHEALPETQALAVAFAPRTPFETVSRVFYTAGQRNIPRFDILVRHEGGLAAIRIDLPSAQEVRDGILMGGAFDDVLAGGVATGRMADVLGLDDGMEEATSADTPPLEPSPPRVEIPTPVAIALEPTEGLSELHLSVTVTPAGLFVSGSGGRLDRGCETVSAGRSITVPSQNGSQDPEGLAACLRRVHDDFPDEDTVTFTADPQVPFEDLAPLMVAARGTEDAPLFPEVRLAVQIR